MRSDTPFEGKQFRQGFFLVVLIAVSVLFMFVVRRFIMPTLLAAITAGLFYPLNRHVRKWMPKQKWLSPIISMLIVIITINVPIGLIGYFVIHDLTMLGKELTTNIDEVQQIIKSTINVFGTLELLTFFGITPETIMSQFNDWIQNIGSFFVNQAVSFSKNTVVNAFYLFIFLYTLYFFFRDGTKTLNNILDYIPMRDADKDEIVEKFVSVTRATVKGTLVVGILHGIMGSLIFWILGIQAPILWGVVIMLISIVPAVGPIVIYVPASIILMVQGHPFNGVFLLVFGIALVIVADYILRPRLIGEDTKIHELLILFGVLGGIMLFGVFGFIIGPIVMSIFVTLWGLFAKTYKRELTFAPHSPSASGQRKRKKSTKKVR